jgi:DNA modification methylase
MFRDRIKSLRRVRAGDLRQNPDNWRTHPESQREALRGVLEEVGLVDACIARELPDGTLELLDGHLRADMDPDQKIPVLIVELDDAEAKKVLATLDPLAAMAEADAVKLDALLREIDTGSEELSKMLAELAEEAGVVPTDVETVDPEPQIDRAAELQVEWKTERWQVWEVAGKAGTHRVMCGDSTSGEDVARLLAGAKPFIMVTDPPYGVEYDPSDKDAMTGIITQNSRRGKVVNDDVSDWTEAYKLFRGDVCYAWHGDRGGVAIDVGSHLRAAGFAIRCRVVWAKQQHSFGRGHYHFQHESAWYAVRTGRPSRWCGDAKQSTIWSISNKQADHGDHGTQKPLECMARPIRNHGGQGDDIYDPFLGSGTTLIAAENLSRVCYGMEISPAYVAVILQRAKDAGMEPRLTT